MDVGLNFFLHIIIGIFYGEGNTVFSIFHIQKICGRLKKGFFLLELIPIMVANDIIDDSLLHAALNRMGMIKALISFGNGRVLVDRQKVLQLAGNRDECFFHGLQLSRRLR